MAVYVDDARIPARVGPISARWSHLFADSQDELHAFAAGIGLKQSWFQPGKPIGRNRRGCGTTPRRAAGLAGTGGL